MFLCAVNPKFGFHTFPMFSIKNPTLYTATRSQSYSLSSAVKDNYILKPFAVSMTSDDPSPEHNSSSKPDPKIKIRSARPKNKVPQNEDENHGRTFPTTIPKKPRRGRKSEAAAVEDFVRGSLEQTFASIRQQSAEVLEDKGNIMKKRIDDNIDSDVSDDDDDDDDEEEEEEEEDSVGGEKNMVVEEDNPNWPVDADVGWGIKASEYFDQHPIKNVKGDDGFEIDWEGELDDTWVKEINCLEWERFAFHPSPLIVLVFERYNRATYNWKFLKELEKAAKVFWSAKDRLPPRTVKIDINIERDLAYALKVREGPEILFLRGNKIVYREKEMRTSDELVQMIAHFYYNAKKPSWVSDAAIHPPF